MLGYKDYRGAYLKLPWINNTDAITFISLQENCNIIRTTSVVVSMKTGSTFASSSVQVRYTFAHERR